MKMLFLTTRLPFPPVGGEKLRAFYFLKYFSRAWEITLLTFVESESEKNALKDLAWIICACAQWSCPALIPI